MLYENCTTGLGPRLLSHERPCKEAATAIPRTYVSRHGNFGCSLVMSVVIFLDVPWIMSGTNPWEHVPYFFYDFYDMRWKMRVALNYYSMESRISIFPVFATTSKGFGVKSWDFIPSGAPVCEYTGKLMRTEDLDNISENNYIFEIDCLQTMNGIGGRERRLRGVSIQNLEKADEQRSENAPEFGITD
ncbi:hypothetical protein ACFE04_006238 [Oxalis oulophora]